MTDDTFHAIPRHGREPIAFYGREIQTVKGKPTGSRHHAIRIFETGGKYVVQIEYFSDWKEEVYISHAFLVDGRENIPAVLAEYDPLADIVGFPDGDQFVKKQIRLEQEITLKFDAMVSDVLGRMGIVERVNSNSKGQ